MSRDDLMPSVREVRFDEGTIDLGQYINALRRQRGGAEPDPTVTPTAAHPLPGSGTTTGALNTAQFRLLMQNPVLTALGHDPAPRVRPGERMHHLFEQVCDDLRAAGQGRRVAVDVGEWGLTYDQLDGHANQLARYLLALGAGPGDRIALLYDGPVYAYVGMLAALKINAAYVPLDPAFPADRIAYIIEDAGARFVLTRAPVRERVEGLDQLPAQVVYVDRAAPAIGGMSRERLVGGERPRAVDELAYIIYTSGSTGRPKGVAIDHPSIVNFLRVAAQVYGVRGDDRVYQGLTVAFDFSIEEIWVPWMVGATLVPKPPGAALLGLDLHEFLATRGVTALCCVPTLLATIEEDLPALRFLLVSGEACPQDLINRWWRPDRRFLNVYGPTEATVTATWTEVHPDRPVTIGVPLPTYTIVVLDPDDPTKAVPRGEIGEIGIAGIGLARGYLNRDDLTAKAFVPDFLDLAHNPSHRIYRTGDLGRVDASGDIEYHGRIDLQVKIRGYRIELTEIESVLLQVPGVAAAVVDTFEVMPGSKELVGYYSLRTDATPATEAAIFEVLRERLPAYMVPAFLEQLDVIPLTTQNKADRKALPAPRARRVAAADGESAEPTNDTERVLAGVLAAVLGLEKVSIDADFFTDLGANSLLMSQFAAKVRKQTPLPAPSSRDTYQNPTIRALARALGGDAGTAAPPTRAVRTRPVERGSGVRHALTGVGQALTVLAAVVGAAFALNTGISWTASAVDLLEVAGRSALVGLALLAVPVVAPIVAKWLLVGRWKRTEFRLWGLAHFRFWLVGTLVKLSPMRIPGSPLYVLYLRALGARIGKGAVILTNAFPVCTDLLAVGEGAVVRPHVSISCYRAENGRIRTGTVVIGAHAVVGQSSVLDVDTAVGEGGQLGHASSLQTGQVVPPGRRMHGSPAQPTATDYRMIPPRRSGAIRRSVFGTLQASLITVIAAAALFLGQLVARAIPYLSGLFGLDLSFTTVQFYLVALVIATLPVVVGLPLALLVVVTVPRLLARFVRPGEVHPLYGVQYSLTVLIQAMTNTGFVRLLGDSAYATTFLSWLGYALEPLRQTGSNFGLRIGHETPYLTSIGTGSMISDGLTISNVDWSASSFRIGAVRIGRDNFFGNELLFPAGATVGDNVLIATKAMVPIDGPVRRDTGLLGSPAFEIPRSTDAGRFDHFLHPDVLPSQLLLKKRHNTATIALYLLRSWFLALVGVLAIKLSVDLAAVAGAFALAAAGLAFFLVTFLVMVLTERATTGFRAQEPRFCSIYDRRFWRHERFWKLSTTNFFTAFNGTAYKGLVLRMLGVRVGRRVYDDGASIPEKTMVTVGDDAVLNARSALWCHTLEDGAFKSDRLTVGVGAALGVGAFVLYGAVVGDGAVLDADSFVLKGEEVAPATRWAGNPAVELRVPVAPTRPALPPRPPVPGPPRPSRPGPPRLLGPAPRPPAPAQLGPRPGGVPVPQGPPPAVPFRPRAQGAQRPRRTS
jgi:non-ribosomal peptide synthetase-like protein